MITRSIVPRMSAGREDPYVHGASTRHHAAIARIEPHQLDLEEARHAHAYVANPSAIELLSRVLDPSIPQDEAAQRTGAMHISPNDLWMAQRLMDTAHLKYGQRPGTKILCGALEQAAQAGKSLVLVNDHPRLSGASRQKSFREEIHHAMQADLGAGESLVGHIWRCQVPFFQDANTRTAVKALSIKYSHISDGQMAAEIGVRLMDIGRFGELGLQ